MKRLSSILILWIFCLNVNGQRNDTAYIYTFGGIQNEGCRQIMPTPDGGYILLGTTNSFGAGNTDFYALKLDSSCRFKWSRCYGGTINEEGYSVVTTLDKGYAFLGFTDSYGAGGYDVFLVKTDSLGNVQWQKTYGGSNWDFGYSLKQLKDSGFLVSGVTYSYGAGNGSMYLIRTDKKGDTLWEKTVGGNGYTTGNSIDILNDSIYLIAGGTTSFGLSDTNACIFKIKDCKDSGSVVSKWIYGGKKTSTFNSIRTVSDKGYIMYGSCDSIPDSIKACAFQDEYCPKIDSNGVMKWCQLIHFPAASIGMDAIELSDHSILSLASTSGGGAGKNDFHVQRFDAGGNWLQATTFGGPEDEIASSIAVGKNGDLLFAGCSDTYPLYSEGLFDIFLVRLRMTDTIPIPYIPKVHNVLDTTQFTSAIPQQHSPVGVNIFPNPLVTSSTILVQGEDRRKYSFSLYNINGQCLINKAPLKNTSKGQAVAVLQKGNLTSGVYSYEIMADGNTKVNQGKIIVQ